MPDTTVSTFEDFFRELQIISPRNGFGVVTREQAEDQWDSIKRNGSTGLHVGQDVIWVKGAKHEL